MAREVSAVRVLPPGSTAQGSQAEIRSAEGGSLSKASRPGEKSAIGPATASSHSAAGPSFFFPAHHLEVLAALLRG